MRRRRLARRAAEAAVGAAERGLRDGRDRCAGRLVRHLALAEDQRAFAGAFVDHLDDAQPSDHGALAGERPVQRDALLAVDDFEPIDAGVALARPEAGMAEHGAHGRQHFQVLLVDEGQFVLVHRIVAEPDAERVEHAVLRRRSFASAGGMSSAISLS